MKKIILYVDLIEHVIADESIRVGDKLTLIIFLRASVRC